MDLTPEEFKALAKRTGLEVEPLQKESQPAEKPENPSLVAVHNLTGRNLLHAVDLGGLAAPSIGIVSRDHPLDEFGEVTLVADRNMVDPKKGVPVFDADVYSPRYPRAKYALKDKPLREFESYINRFAREIGDDSFDIREDLSTGGVEGIKEKAARQGPGQTSLRYAFLREAGVPIEVPTRAPRLLRNRWSSSPALQEFKEKYGVDHSAQPGSEYARRLSDTVRQAMKEYLRERYELRYDDPQKVDARVAEDFRILAEKHFDPVTGELLAESLDSTVLDLERLSQRVPDYYGVRDTIEKVFSEDPSLATKFEEWLDKKLSPIQGDRYFERYTSTGNVRRHKYTLDNILREVTRDTRGGEGFFYGAGSVRAQGAQRFRSLGQMKGSDTRLAPKEEADELKSRSNKRLIELAERASRYHRGDSWRATDILGEAIGESYKRGRGLRSILTRYGYKGMPEELVEEIEDFARELVEMPTEYFEAKPQRIVRLGEFRGAVIPDDAPATITEALRQQGISRIEMYKRGDKRSRATAINRIAEEEGLYLSEKDLWGTKMSKFEVTPEEFEALAKRTGLEVEPLRKNGQALSRSDLAVRSDGREVTFNDDMEPLEKNLFRRALTAGVAASLAAAPATLDVTTPPEAPEPPPVRDEFVAPPNQWAFLESRTLGPPEPPPTEEPDRPFELGPYSRWTDEGVPPDLRAIARLESSYGVNMLHAPHSKGKFHTAFGALGFKPVSAYEQYLRSPELKEKYPGYEDDIASFTEKFRRDAIFYNDVAADHWNWLKRRAKGDLARTAFSWRWGQGAGLRASPEKIAADPYVQRFSRLLERERNRPLETPTLKSEDFTPLEKMALADNPPGKPPAVGQEAWDYSHLLPPDLAESGYRIEVEDYDGSLVADLIDRKGYSLGSVQSLIRDNALSVEHAELEWWLQGKGLGPLLYEAVMQHAYQQRGIREVRGGDHSTMASRAHQKVAKKHKLKYRPLLHEGMEDEEPGPFDFRFQPYKYSLE